jgi:hypothetical protein
MCVFRFILTVNSDYFPNFNGIFNRELISLIEDRDITKVLEEASVFLKY